MQGGKHKANTSSQSLVLQLRHHPPTHIKLTDHHPLPLPPLTNLRNLLNQCLDAVDITLFTGPRPGDGASSTPEAAQFLSSQLRLLQGLLAEAYSTLRGPVALGASPTPETWLDKQLPSAFEPPLPESLSLDFGIQDASLILLVRALQPADAVPSLQSRFLTAFAPRHAEHDEWDRTFDYGGKEVRVREKVRVEAADPVLMSVMSKLAALEHAVGMGRVGLSAVMRDGVEDIERLCL
jgi:hypothetical protein